MDPLAIASLICGAVRDMFHFRGKPVENEGFLDLLPSSSFIHFWDYGNGCKIAAVSVHVPFGFGSCTLHTWTVADSEGKDPGHHTEYTRTFCACGCKSPTDESCPRRCSCHPKKAKGISFPASSRRLCDHYVEPVRKFLHFRDASKTKSSSYIPCTQSISIEQAGQGPERPPANS